jgi:predicted TIM-barrel fold metal-dependent hydrolase
MHVVDPDTYPLSADAAYIPKTHSLAQAQAFESSLGLHNIVLVQPSIYGTDNACLLSALYALGPSRARAVVAFDPASTPEKVLREWHAAGVRGTRVNLLSQGGPTPTADELAVMLRSHADVLRPLGWVLQLYVPLALVDVLEPLIPELGVRVVIDHMGQPSLPRAAEGGGAAGPPLDPYELPGFAALVRLLRAGQTFVKLSAPYRISRAADYGDLEPVAKELLRVAGRNRVVFATDWPHTRFDGLDIRPWVDKVFELCGDDAALVDRIFRGNAEDLWDVQPQKAAE